MTEAIVCRFLSSPRRQINDSFVRRRSSEGNLKKRRDSRPRAKTILTCTLPSSYFFFKSFIQNIIYSIHLDGLQPLETSTSAILHIIIKCRWESVLTTWLALYYSTGWMNLFFTWLQWSWSGSCWRDWFITSDQHQFNVID